jgi:hypothetical protein
MVLGLIFSQAAPFSGAMALERARVWEDGDQRSQLTYDNSTCCLFFGFGDVKTGEVQGPLPAPLDSDPLVSDQMGVHA